MLHIVCDAVLSVSFIPFSVLALALSISTFLSSRFIFFFRAFVVIACACSACVPKTRRKRREKKCARVTPFTVVTIEKWQQRGERETSRIEWKSMKREREWEKRYHFQQLRNGFGTIFELSERVLCNEWGKRDNTEKRVKIVRCVPRSRTHVCKWRERRRKRFFGFRSRAACLGRNDYSKLCVGLRPNSNRYG